jgi:hypothetical protein
MTINTNYNVNSVNQSSNNYAYNSQNSGSSFINNQIVSLSPALGRLSEILAESVNKTNTEDFQSEKARKDKIDAFALQLQNIENEIAKMAPENSLEFSSEQLSKIKDLTDKLNKIQENLIALKENDKLEDLFQRITFDYLRLKQSLEIKPTLITDKNNL